MWVLAFRAHGKLKTYQCLQFSFFIMPVYELAPKQKTVREHNESGSRVTACYAISHQFRLLHSTNVIFVFSYSFQSKTFNCLSHLSAFTNILSLQFPNIEYQSANRYANIVQVPNRSRPSTHRNRLILHEKRPTLYQFKKKNV